MMKVKIIYTHFVKADLKEINQWYSKIDKKIWNFFIEEFYLKIDFISENALASEIKYDVSRIVFLRKFPYGIHYQFDEFENEVKIYAIFHTSRNLENWIERK